MNKTMKNEIKAEGHHRGCGTQIHPIGTNGGTMACGGMLRHLTGELTPVYCPDCTPEAAPAPAGGFTPLTGDDLASNLLLVEKERDRLRTALRKSNSLLQGELGRASERGLELRWESIRKAISLQCAALAEGGK